MAGGPQSQAIPHIANMAADIKSWLTPVTITVHSCNMKWIANGC
jgi:hypothetical protein